MAWMSSHCGTTGNRATPPLRGWHSSVSPLTLIETIFTAAQSAAVKILSRNYLSSMRSSIAEVSNASLNDGRLLGRAQPARKAKRRNLPLVKAPLSRRSLTPRALLIELQISMNNSHCPQRLSLLRPRYSPARWLPAVRFK